MDEWRIIERLRWFGYRAQRAPNGLWVGEVCGRQTDYCASELEALLSATQLARQALTERDEEERDERNRARLRELLDTRLPVRELRNLDIDLSDGAIRLMRWEARWGEGQGVYVVVEVLERPAPEVLEERRDWWSRELRELIGR